jgi:hypothetical protein
MKYSVLVTTTAYSEIMFYFDQYIIFFPPCFGMEVMIGDGIVRGYFYV